MSPAGFSPKFFVERSQVGVEFAREHALMTELAQTEMKAAEARK